MTYLNCPRCGLSLREPRMGMESSVTCPRCAGRKKLEIPMFRSSKPIRLSGSVLASGAAKAAISSDRHPARNSRAEGHNTSEFHRWGSA